MRKYLVGGVGIGDEGWWVFGYKKWDGSWGGEYGEEKEEDEHCFLVGFLG